MTLPWDLPGVTQNNRWWLRENILLHAVSNLLCNLMFLMNLGMTCGYSYVLISIEWILGSSWWIFEHISMEQMRLNVLEGSWIGLWNVTFGQLSDLKWAIIRVEVAARCHPLAVSAWQIWNRCCFREHICQLTFSGVCDTAIKPLGSEFDYSETWSGTICFTAVAVSLHVNLCEGRQRLCKQPYVVGVKGSKESVKDSWKVTSLNGGSLYSEL